MHHGAPCAHCGWRGDIVLPIDPGGPKVCELCAKEIIAERRLAITTPPTTDKSHPTCDKEPNP